MRPDASENSQINPSTIVRAARAAGSQPYLPSGFQGRCKSLLSTLVSESSGECRLSLEEFRKVITTHVEALNHAVRDIPPERMRMHICWASTQGPHHKDVPLKDIVDIVLKGRPQALSFPGANPRHEHEWKVWKDVKLPDGKIIIPGVIDSTSNFVEHPELVADRIVQYARVVGAQNVIAGVDCGFGTFAGRLQVDSKIVWMKLASLAEGARLASKQLW